MQTVPMDGLKGERPPRSNRPWRCAGWGNRRTTAREREPHSVTQHFTTAEEEAVNASKAMQRVWAGGPYSGYQSPGLEECHYPEVPGGSVCDMLLGDDGSVRGVIFSRSGIVFVAGCKTADRDAFLDWLDFMQHWWFPFESCMVPPAESS